MSMKELRDMTTEQLQSELLDLQKEAFNLRMQKSMESGVKPHQFGQVKRSIARVKTVMNEKRKQNEHS